MQKLNNEHTKLQIRTWLENAIKMAQNPDPREEIRRIRRHRIESVIKNFGF